MSTVGRLCGLHKPCCKIWLPLVEGIMCTNIYFVGRYLIGGVNTKSLDPRYIYFNFLSVDFRLAEYKNG